MLCQNCGKNEATTHVKRVVNGDTTEMHLCQNCAEHLGYGDLFSGFGFDLGNIFSGLLGEDMPLLSSAHEEKCPKCGYTFSDIVKNGRLGCADCYRKFYDRLLPSLQRIHGKIKHTGKQATMIPHVAEDKAPKIDPIMKLKEDMQKAIDEQNFEQAAVLRDRIKEMEAGNNE